ncbi:hypothetical protein CK203_054048 [Vitis vinifera]|uniref:Uncharacterized protein n=1 Tax=Vitis vinifera TaxID=29760 RepID=A0A438GIN4_VITVI|nr:hypothetical protein CK203_054048 [Vitis vinifera]
MSANKEATSSGSSGDAQVEKSVDKLSMKEFRERFCIPNGVLVELMDEEAMSTEKSEDHAIVFTKEQFNARLRFPLPSLFKEFLHFTQIPPAYIHRNIVWVLMGCSIFSLLFNLDLSLLEVLFVYSSRREKMIFLAWLPTCLPSTGDWVARLDEGRSEGTCVGLRCLGCLGEAIFPKPFVGPGQEGSRSRVGRKSVVRRLNKLFEISAAERHHETLLTARNLLAVVREPQVYIINILPRKLPKKVVLGEHYILKDLPFYKEVQKADAQKRRALLDDRRGGGKRELCGRLLPEVPPLPSVSSGSGRLAGLNHSGPSLSVAGRLHCWLRSYFNKSTRLSPSGCGRSRGPLCCSIASYGTPNGRKWGRKSRFAPYRPSPPALYREGVSYKEVASARDLKSGLIGQLQDRFLETIEVSCSSVQEDYRRVARRRWPNRTQSPRCWSRWGFTRRDPTSRNEGAPDPEEESLSNASSGGSPVDDAACIPASSFQLRRVGRETETDSTRLRCCHAFSKIFEVVETAFVSQRKNNEEKLRLRLEQAEASLSAAREDNEALWTELAEAKSREEFVDARLHEGRTRWPSEGGGEASPDGEGEELEADYQKQVDKMYFFG